MNTPITRFPFSKTRETGIKLIDPQDIIRIKAQSIATTICVDIRSILEQKTPPPSRKSRSQLFPYQDDDDKFSRISQLIDTWVFADQLMLQTMEPKDAKRAREINMIVESELEKVSIIKFMDAKKKERELYEEIAIYQSKNYKQLMHCKYQMSSKAAAEKEMVILNWKTKAQKQVRSEEKEGTRMRGQPVEKNELSTFGSSDEEVHQESCKKGKRSKRQKAKDRRERLEKIVNEQERVEEGEEEEEGMEVVSVLMGKISSSSHRIPVRVSKEWMESLVGGRCSEQRVEVEAETESEKRVEQGKKKGKGKKRA